MKRTPIEALLTPFVREGASGRSAHAIRPGTVEIAGRNIPIYIDAFWTARQRQANRIHEVPYRACFKPQLPRFFIELFSEPGDLVYDPFSGRGTTVLEAALLDRNIVSNDSNPLSGILCSARLFPPNRAELEARLALVFAGGKSFSKHDLSMFYHPKTESEIGSLRSYLHERRADNREDELDRWIRMVATSRLTGHSSGFFSVYTLPPNQAVSRERQLIINTKRKQQPEYRDTRKLILKKTGSLTGGITEDTSQRLRRTGRKALFLTGDARATPEIGDSTVQLTVTSPPFLDVVQYAQDNWLRCWFNGIDPDEVASRITVPRSIRTWREVMGAVFVELFRITRPGGTVAFEVGEVRGGRVKLEETVVPLGLEAGFGCEGIMINQQTFTKTAHIWGVSNNTHGTNTNRIVIFTKD
ncbi:MAG: DNA methyltransferase [Candidatus Latescibacterota bacterium]